MKKLSRIVLALFASFFVVVVGAFFCGNHLLEINQIAKAEGVSGVYTINLDFDADIFEIEQVEYIVDGVNVTYNKNGYIVPAEPGGDEYITAYYKVVFGGVSGNIGLMAGEAGEYYYVDDPFYEKLGECGVASKKISVDPTTDLKLKLSHISKSVAHSNYVRSFSYKVGSSGSSFIVDSTTLNNAGEAKFTESRFDAVNGYYTSTVNVFYTFNYNYTSDGFEVTVKSARSNMTLAVDSAYKNYKVNLTGKDAGEAYANKTSFYYNEANPVVITINPNGNKIVDEIKVLYGDDNILTLNGGMETRGTYYFKNGLDFENKVSYSNFAIGYVSDLELNRIDVVGKALIASPEEFVGGVNELYVQASVYDDGTVVIELFNAHKNITIDISTQKYAQLDLEQYQDGIISTSEPFSSVKLGNAVFDENIPNRIFAVGFEEVILIEATLKDGYNYTSVMDASLINSKVFSNPTFSGGKITIQAEEQDTYSFTVVLYKDGKQFADSATQILINGELSNLSSQGRATIRGVRGGPDGDKIEAEIRLSCYYMMFYNGENCSNELSVSYENIIENILIEIEVKNFSIIKPVVFENEKIGDVKIDLLRVQTSSGGGYRATYNVTFKAVGSQNFSVIRTSNPSVYGYDFVNMSVVDENGESVDILRNYAGGTFGVDPTNLELHEFLASVVFNIPDNGKEIVAKFAESIIDFSLIDVINNLSYNGVTYYNYNEIYLENPVVVSEVGKYFSGFSAIMDQGLVSFLTLENQDPIYIESGEFAGYYKYLIQSSWNVGENDVSFDIEFDNRTFSVEFVFATSETTSRSLLSDIKYGSEFSIQELNTQGWADPTIGGLGYRLIGWELDNNSEIYYKIADSATYLYFEIFTYEWVENVRFVPVFSANSSTINIYDGPVLLNSVLVRYDEISSLEKLLFVNDEWIEINKFGYNFLGFYDSEVGGKCVINFIDGNYEFNYLNNADKFKAIGDDYSWILEDNLNLYTRFSAIEYMLELNTINESYRDDDIITSSVGRVEYVSDGKYLVSGFVVTDTVVLAGIAPLNDFYIANINCLVVDSSGDTILNLLSYSATCDRDGLLIEENHDERFNFSENEYSIVVAEFLNESLKGSKIVVEIEYKPVTYIVSFTANMVGLDGREILNCPSETVYYSFSKADATILNVENWTFCDAEGYPIENKTGWQNLTMISDFGSVEFKENSLYGICGIVHNVDGVKYSFNFWYDFDDEFKLSEDSIITSGKHFVTGYFWYFDGNSITLGETITANAYEIYLIGGKLYYIDAWSDIQLTSITENVDEEHLFDVYSSFLVSYSNETINIDFYAVYNEYTYLLVENASNYEMTVDLPNDPNGNTYSSDDVLWVAVSKTDFDGYGDSKLSVADKLAQIFSHGDALALNTVMEKGTFSKAISISSDKYLFAVIQRKVDGVKVNAFYMAIKVF